MFNMFNTNKTACRIVILFQSLDFECSLHEVHRIFCAKSHICLILIKFGIGSVLGKLPGEFRLVCIGPL
jgi:hypothetical protein